MPVTLEIGVRVLFIRVYSIKKLRPKLVENLRIVQ